MAFLKTQNNSSILTITISRPESMNALNSQLLDSLNEIIQKAYRNSEVKGILLTGEGEKAFVAGADIKELASLTHEEALNLAQKGQKLFKLIEDCPKPVVCAINGVALGGGCELAMACHIRIASENARFGQPEVNLGIIPGFGGTQRLTQLVGRGKSLELLLTGDIITAQEAKAVGLVNHVVSGRDELIKFSTSLLEKMVSKSSIVLERVIRSVNAGFSFEHEGYLEEAKYFAECVTTEDFKEGTSAFLEKRKPVFKDQ